MEIPQIQQQLQINRVLLAANHEVLPQLIEHRNYLRAQGNEIRAEREHKVVVATENVVNGQAVGAATRKVIARYAGLQKALKKDYQRALLSAREEY